MCLPWAPPSSAQVAARWWRAQLWQAGRVTILRAVHPWALWFASKLVKYAMIFVHAQNRDSSTEILCQFRSGVDILICHAFY